MIVIDIILIIAWSILAIVLLRNPNEYYSKNSIVALISISIALHLLVDILTR